MTEQRHRAVASVMANFLRHRRMLTPITAAISSCTSSAPGRVFGCGRLLAALHSCDSLCVAARRASRLLPVEFTRLRAASLMAASHAVYASPSRLAGRLCRNAIPHRTSMNAVLTLTIFEDAELRRGASIRSNWRCCRTRVWLDLAKNCAATGAPAS